VSEKHEHPNETHQNETHQPPAPVTRTVTLPSRRAAVIRAGRGRDLIQAQRAVGRTAESTALLQALVAILCTVDGKELTYEDVLEMPVADVLMLEGEVLGNFPQAASPAPPVWPDSSTSGSAPASSAK
jgi:hypothetical protein